MTRIFPEHEKPLLLAHRGLHTHKRENTISAFLEAVKAGADGIELDVHLTSDGSLAVIHDDNTIRTTGIDRNVENSTIWELKQTDPELPTLEEVFEAFPDIYYDIELKCPSLRPGGMEKKVLSVIEEYGMQDKVMISSFDPVALVAFRRHSKGKLPVSIIYDIDPRVPRIAQKGFFRHFVKADILKPGLNIADRQIGRLKYEFSVWCPDTAQEAAFYLEKGARIIITNRIDLIRRTV